MVPCSLALVDNDEFFSGGLQVGIDAAVMLIRPVDSYQNIHVRDE